MEAYKEYTGKRDKETQLPKESALIREVVDKHMYKGEPIKNLSKKQLRKALYLMLMYVPFLEVTLKKKGISELDTSIVE